jgi:hypothetical protein
MLWYYNPLSSKKLKECHKTLAEVFIHKIGFSFVLPFLLMPTNFIAEMIEH